ncbi:MAG: menaquinone biosynthesis protein, partial [Rikenellaceae bacterium]
AITPKIAAVSYLNTIPFIYGIEHEGNFSADLLLLNPADCAQAFASGEVDIALVPAATVPTLPLAEVVSGYCIGASGEVRTVVIVSDDPIDQVKRIFVDSHSRTSVQLAGYLAKHRWNIDPEWIEFSDLKQLSQAEDGDAFLLIGDKVFEHEDEFDYTYDLAQEWMALTELPFAFAVWVARKGTSYEVIDALEQALEFGVEHLYEAILEYRADESVVESYQYLSENIDFLFDAQKRKALNKFWDSGIKIMPKSNPG